jgi:hypothetical protein
VHKAKKDYSSVEDLFVEWYDGTSWNELAAIEDDKTWSAEDYTCPSGADDNANFKFRFRTNVEIETYIDDVEIVGTD